MAKATKHINKSKSKHKHPEATLPKKWHPAPLKSSFMLLSILGFFVTIFMVLPRFPSMGTAFLIVFIAMFVAAVVSMTKAPVINENK